jgi:archaellum component FlaF (FlaF/FlaG flagellin family)
LSPLTKLFIGLHVILSAMLVAGVIVFVNKQETFKATTDAAVARADRATQDRNADKSALDAEIATYKSNVNTLNGTITSLKSQLAAAQTKNNEQAATIADSSSKLQLAMAESAKLAEGMTASQATQGKLNEAVASLRKVMDTQVTQGSEMSARISDLTNKLQVTETERKFLAEQLTQARSENDSITNQAKAMGIELNTAPAYAAGATVGPPINGVIRNIDQIAGSLYATISVGTADSVSKGMQFNVVERGTGKFLGLLTVTAVEANEASGKIVGPNTAAVKPGAEVKTQL